MAGDEEEKLANNITPNDKAVHGKTISCLTHSLKNKLDDTWTSSIVKLSLLYIVLTRCPGCKGWG